MIEYRNMNRYRSNQKNIVLILNEFSRFKFQWCLTTVKINPLRIVLIKSFLGSILKIGVENLSSDDFNGFNYITLTVD